MKKFIFIPFLVFLLMAIIGVFRLAAQPSIFVNGFNLNYGEVVLLQTYPANVMIINNGDQPLQVTDISFSGADFSASETSFEISPSSFKSITVFFTPEVLGELEETMIVESNATQQPLFELPITANVGIPVAEYLVAQNSSDEVNLSWGADGSDGFWLKYDNGQPSSYISFFGGSGQFVVGSKWTADELADQFGQFISRVAFFPTGLFADFAIQIRSGANGQDILYEGIATQIDYFNWNEYILTDPVEINSGQDYWIALQITQFNDMDASVAYDSQLAEDGLGNLILVDGQWQSMTTYGFYSNWMIRGFLSESGNKMANASAVIGNYFQRTMNNGELQLANNAPLDRSFNHELLKNASEFILGYNIYRDGVLLNSQPVTTSTFRDVTVEPGTYTYEVTIVFDGVEGDPIARVVMAAAPELRLNPVSVIIEEIENTETIEQTVSLENTGFTNLEWEVGDTLPFWLSISSSSGTIAPGATINLTLTIDPDGLMAGPHYFNVKLSTNNANKSDYFLHVYLFVTGQTVLAISGTDFHFGRVAIGKTKSMQIEFTNISDAPVYIFSVWYYPYTGFYSYSNMSVLQPGQTGKVIMSAWPDQVGLIEGEVEISYFNYLGAGTLKFPMSVEGFILQPANLALNLDDTEQEVTLSWLTPGFVTNELFFGNGIPSGILPTSGTITTQIAKKFTRSNLMFYNDQHLEQVAVSFADASTNAEITVKIYTTEEPDIPVFSIPVTDPESFSWNVVTLPQPIQLDTLDFLWLTYEINPDSNSQVLIATADKGPAVVGSGDLIKVGDAAWTTLSQFGISRNFGIKGLLSSGGNKSFDETPGLTTKNNNPPANLMGYRVYRNGEMLNDELLQETVFVDSLQEGGVFTYGVSAFFTYGESVPVESTVSLPVIMTMPAGLEFNRTSIAHNIEIPKDVAQMGVRLNHGDMIGVFFYNQNGILRSAGAALWQGEHTVLTAYGNNPQTDIKDGFNEGDTLIWKVFRHETSATIDIDVAYFNHMSEHDGTFAMMGSSMIYLIEMQDATVDLATSQIDFIKLYPNPSSGRFAINGLSDGDRIRIFDASGRVVLNDFADGVLHAMSLERAGIYIIEINTIDGKTVSLQQIIY